MARVVISRRGQTPFVLPDDHTATVDGASVTLEGDCSGGRYALDGVAITAEGTTIEAGQLELGWWNGAAPGVPCEYPFPE